MYYQAAGSRATTEERGLERRRKLDGLRKWKFDDVLQMFPVLLQLALLLFSSAIPVYLWSIPPSETSYFRLLAQLSTVIQFYKERSDPIDDPGDAMSSDKWAFHTFTSLDLVWHIALGQKGSEHFLDNLHVNKILSLEESTFVDYLCFINSFFAPINPQMLVEVDKSRLRVPPISVAVKG
ncbi:hypothetical protein B0H13DRAFT_1866441 [Mycena leptocephala]|nr:hypothetical protein B0H13DRAFT_1866441 [Mycena leptocephala]